MAILKPVSAYPNRNTIDANTQNTFSTTIQGASSVVFAYNLFVYDMDTYTEIYDSGKIQLDAPLTANELLEVEFNENEYVVNGNSYYWLIRLYQYESTIFITSSVVQSGATNTEIPIRIHNNVKDNMSLEVNGEKRKITTYNSETGIATLENYLTEIPAEGDTCKIYSDFVDSLNFPFFAKSSGAIELVGLNPTGYSRYGKFYANFVQEQNIGIRWHKFQLYSSAYDLIEDTGRQYNSKLYFSYGSLQNGEYYFVKCTIEDSTGNITESDLLRVDVNYRGFDLGTNIKIDQNCDMGYVSLAWESDRFIDGIATGEYNYITNTDTYLSGQTITGIPESGVNYVWDESESWNDELYWTETNAESGQIRAKITSGEIYYNKIYDDELNIDSDSFTLFTDIKLNSSKQGKLVSLSGVNSDYFVFVEGYDIKYSLNDIETKLFSIYSTIESGQSDGIPIVDVGYVWDDSDIWDDDLRWTESLDITKSAKITMLPTETRAYLY